MSATKQEGVPPARYMPRAWSPTKRAELSPPFVSSYNWRQLFRKLAQQHNQQAEYYQRYAALTQYLYSLTPTPEAAEQERRNKAIALLRSWREEGDEAEQRETFEALKQGLNAHHSSGRTIYP